MIVAVLLFVIPLKKTVRIFAAVSQAALFGFALYVFFLCKDGETITRVGNFGDFLGITLRADTLTSVFLMLTSFVFLVATIYCFSDNYSRLFWFFLFVWQGLLNGVFLSNDVFNVFVLIEVATIVVAALIMFNRDNRSMYDGMVYLMLDIVAMQFFLFGAGYIYKLTGTLDMTLAAQLMAHIDKSSLILPFALIMTPISLKCALIPLFSWLPKAHGTPGAPSAVSAVLSGLHIKCGVYLFIRFQDVFSGIDSSLFFLLVGIITGVVGFILAISQTDIKLILAYSTISQIGMIITGLSIQHSYAHTGALYHAINHAFFKAALFLGAGVLIEAYGARNINQIRGVLRRYPLVGAAIVMAVCGITGAPLFNGSISKYFIMTDTNAFVSAALIFINLGTIITFIKFSTILFGGRKLESEIIVAPVKIPMAKQITVLVLSSLCFVGGIFGEGFIHFLFNITVDVDAAGYLEKTGLFAISAIAGYLIFRFFVDKHPFFKHIRGLDMNFRWMCASIGGFFAAVLLFTRFFAVL